jgi:hypothetical protein
LDYTIIPGEGNIIAYLVPRLTKREEEKEANSKVMIASNKTTRDKIELKVTGKEEAENYKDNYHIWCKFDVDFWGPK